VVPDKAKNETMKIKIITCSRAYNLGAALQTYALQTYLISLKQEVKVIDYNPPYFSRNVSYRTVGSFANKNWMLQCLYMLYKVPQRFVDHRIFKGFLRKYIQTTKEYHSVRELEEAQLKADLFICGSDQIWCPTKPTGKDVAMYLSFVKKGKKVAYAASFGEEVLSREQMEFLQNQIHDFLFLSVRETTGVEIVKKAGFECVQVMDPVFLISQDKWIVFSSKSVKYKKFGSYLLVYPMSLADPAFLFHAAREIAREKNLNVVIIGKSKRGVKKTDYYVNNASPQDFVSLIQHSSFVVTNSFHGTCFSILFRKEFVVYGKEAKPNTRIDSLLKLIGLSERYTKDKNLIIDSPIDYNLLRPVLTKYLLASQQYLAKAIHSDENV
jgi:hypothetical protein